MDFVDFPLNPLTDCTHFAHLFLRGGDLPKRIRGCTIAAAAEGFAAVFAAAAAFLGVPRAAAAAARLLVITDDGMGAAAAVRTRQDGVVNLSLFDNCLVFFCPC